MTPLTQARFSATLWSEKSMKTKYLFLPLYLVSELCFSLDVEVVAKSPWGCEFLGAIESIDHVSYGSDGEASEESTIQELKAKAVRLGGNVLEHESPETQELLMTHGFDGGKTYVITRSKVYKCPNMP